MIPRFRTALRLAFTVGVTTAVLARVAFGQVAAPAVAPARDPSALSPPKLVTFVEATYPATARAAHLQAGVDVALTVDATGKVTDARVVAPAGNAFYEAAVEAALRFVFEPARRGDHAIAARIKYHYVFDLGAEAPAAPAAGELGGPGARPGRGPDHCRRGRHAGLGRRSDHALGRE